jgi:hypothetical protein
MTSTNPSTLQNLDLTKLNIQDDDKATRKLLMLIEGTFGIGVQKSIAKYGYSEQRYYQLKKAFLECGSQALVDQKTGPKTNTVRTDKVEKQIIRLRFLNPQDSAEVITQKLNQMGLAISQRSVERTITTYGLQKKTFTP